MAIRFFQVPEGIQTGANPPSETHSWKLVGSSSKDYVNQYAMSATPAIVASSYGILYRQDLRVKSAGHLQWMVEVPYSPKKREKGSYTWNFDTTGGSVHVKTAKQEVARYPTNTAPDQKGVIGVDGDEVLGTDVVIPAGKFNVQFKHPLGVVTPPFFRYLISLTGSVNSDPFFGFAPGEVLFLGGRGADGSDAEASVDYQFAVSSNATGLTIGSITGIAKKGWDVLWVRWEDSEEAADGVTHPVRKPKFVYIDRVYNQIAMATALGFGG